MSRNTALIKLPRKRRVLDTALAQPIVGPNAPRIVDVYPPLDADNYGKQILQFSAPVSVRTAPRALYSLQPFSQEFSAFDTVTQRTPTSLLCTGPASINQTPNVVVWQPSHELFPCPQAARFPVPFVVELIYPNGGSDVGFAFTANVILPGGWDGTGVNFSGHTIASIDFSEELVLFTLNSPPDADTLVSLDGPASGIIAVTDDTHPTPFPWPRSFTARHVIGA